MFAVEDVYIAELMVESNITLEASTIQTVFTSTTDIQVLDSTSTEYTVSLSNSELSAGIRLNLLIFYNQFFCNTLIKV